MSFHINDKTIGDVTPRVLFTNFCNCKDDRNLSFIEACLSLLTNQIYCGFEKLLMKIPESFDCKMFQNEVQQTDVCAAAQWVVSAM